MGTMDTLSVDLGDRPNDINVGSGILTDAARLISPVLAQQRVIIVSDENVAPHYMTALVSNLSSASIATDEIVLPAGEQTKDFRHLEDLIDQLLALKIERGTTLIALGGGVIGDLTGFAASAVLRGVDFVQIPTTLLSQVDSSVGGKTGINTRHGKNLVGAFYQPRLVIADIDTLDTLSAREIRSGYAEVAKYGLINDFNFFSWLEGSGKSLCDGDKDARRRAVLTSCAAKAKIVAEDEKEHDRRALLNLGHTFGHTLEAETGYGDRLLHGEAVGIGIQMAFDLSVQMGLCPGQDAERVRAHYDAVGLPISPAQIPGMNWNADALLSHMASDKKVLDGAVTFILAKKIGETFVSRTVDMADVRIVVDRAITP
jgi:3-dehydroquinate synthase